MTLTPEDHRAIAQEVAALLRETPHATEEIMTRAEAARYVKRPSPAAFCRWCRQWGVKPYQRGRYSRSHIALALSREARKRAA